MKIILVEEWYIVDDSSWGVVKRYIFFVCEMGNKIIIRRKKVKILINLLKLIFFIVKGCINKFLWISVRNKVKRFF